jgi:plastocyanin
MCAESRLEAAAAPKIDGSRQLDKISMSELGAKARLPWYGAVLGMICSGLCAGATAATLGVEISDRDGGPVAEVVVYATPLGVSPPRELPAKPIVISQNHERFSPHVLVVQTGTAVSFPNEDTVSHHVYSFSKPKTFELPLYKGTAYPPVVFDRPGIVDIGCNIHDRMEAHIVVVDTPYFAVTAADGRASLEHLPPGEYAIGLYTPRLRSAPETARVTLNDAIDTMLPIRFEDRLRPPHEVQNGSLSWSHY